MIAQLRQAGQSCYVPFGRYLVNNLTNLPVLTTELLTFVRMTRTKTSIETKSCHNWVCNQFMAQRNLDTLKRNVIDTVIEFAR